MCCSLLTTINILAMTSILANANNSGHMSDGAEASFTVPVKDALLCCLTSLFIN
jgi:hypothetical protein